MSTGYAVTLSKFQLGDMVVEYLLATESQSVGLRLYPISTTGRLVTRREFLRTHEALLQPKFMPLMRAWQVEPLVQFKEGLQRTVDWYRTIAKPKTVNPGSEK